MDKGDKRLYIYIYIEMKERRMREKDYSKEEVLTTWLYPNDQFLLSSFAGAPTGFAH